jgi:D-glycero-D-manno-heptose 1,7-bisphosphate phosphatase
LQAIEETGIAADETIFVGDASRDLEAARAAGVAPYLVRTGKGRATEASLSEPVPTFDDLEELARALVANR